MHCNTCVLFTVLFSGVVHHLSLQMDDPAPLLRVQHHMLITECNMCTFYYMCYSLCCFQVWCITRPFKWTTPPHCCMCCTTCWSLNATCVWYLLCCFQVWCITRPFKWTTPPHCCVCCTTCWSPSAAVRALPPAVVNPLL